MWTFAECFPNELAEERVSPRKPRTRELLRVIFVESFVHEACASVCAPQSIQTLLDLAITCCCQGLHDQAQRPDHIHPDMRPTQTICCLSNAVIWVIRG